jgi:uncharacterized protein (TIGR03086 family)
MSNDVIDRLSGLIAAFDARVHATPADRWANPAPCEGWTATDVVAHVAEGCAKLTAGLTGDAPAAFDPADPVGSWNAARDAVLAAVRSADLSTPIPGPMGPMPAEQLVGRFMATDVLVHTWDLARAVGGDERLDEAAVAGAYSGLKPMDAMIRRPGVFGPKVEAPEGADLQTEFLSFLGRQV